MSKNRLNLDEPRYDQSTFDGRLKHFMTTTNPANVLIGDTELDEAKRIVEAYKKGEEFPNLSDDQIWKHKEVYDSAFHPQTGEKLFMAGRMSFQVPGNMAITGCMMTFYRSTPAVIFWQTANQSFNAVVNYTNRNASVGVSNEQLGTAYAAATSASVATALLFNKIVSSSPSLANGIVGRLVPLVAVAAANCVNIPCMRQQELKNGITVSAENGEELGPSTAAAMDAVTQVIPSRVAMAVPGMFVPPVVMSKLEKTAMFIKNPWLKAPATVLLTGIMLTFATPVGCAIFPQKAGIDLSRLDPALQEKAKAKFPGQTTFYYNKGL